MDQSPRTPATSQDPSVKREFDYQMVDLTGNIIKQEPALRSIESSSAPIKRQYSTTSNNPTPLNAPIQRHRPTPPLFDSTTHQGKRKREEWDEEDALVGMPPAPRRPNVVIDLTDE